MFLIIADPMKTELSSDAVINICAFVIKTFLVQRMEAICIYHIVSFTKT